MTTSDNILIKVKDLSTKYKIKGGFFGRKVGELRAVNKVNISINKGETLGLVGESGCGKTTLGKSILRLIEPTSGQIIFGNVNINELNFHDMKEMRRKMQIIFQDPFSSLNPRMKIHSILSEPLYIHKLYQGKNEINKRLNELLKNVNMPQSCLDKYPHEFSGGERQRICIARALALKPEFIVFDECVSSLDASTQLQIINLLIKLQKDLGLTYLFISPNLKLIKYISHQVAVMYLGNIIEQAPTEELYFNPRHPYTKALISSIPKDDLNFIKDKIILNGDIPNQFSLPKGCHFHPKCWKATDICKEEFPQQHDDGGHMYRCYHPL